jgi:hypothetical protein
MHYPQLPDPGGWDVRISNGWTIADDWLCTETGPVSDVHFWVSWADDVVGNINRIHLSVHSNIPKGPDDWSIPGDELWARDFDPALFVVRPYGDGPQGWFEPPETFNEQDHDLFFQVNVTDIVDPFIQQEGEMYWLDITAETEGGVLGWKTSGSEHFMDDATYLEPTGRWLELRDPLTQESLDMAFVVNVPEPGSCLLLVIGAAAGLCVVWRRRRARTA